MPFILYWFGITSDTRSIILWDINSFGWGPSLLPLRRWSPLTTLLLAFWHVAPGAAASPVGAAELFPFLRLQLARGAADAPPRFPPHPPSATDSALHPTFAPRSPRVLCHPPRGVPLFWGIYFFSG